MIQAEERSCNWYGKYSLMVAMRAATQSLGSTPIAKAASNESVFCFV